MKDTCGQNSMNSLTSADLQQSLESRLQQILDLNGSPEYALTWKTVDMPLGPPICALRAWAHRTLDNDSSGEQLILHGWATPVALDHKSAEPNKLHRYLRGVHGFHRLQDQTLLLAETLDTVELNPAFSRWLTGYPTRWDECSPGIESYNYVQQELTKMLGSPRMVAQ